MPKIFRPHWESIREHELPSWYEEAKFGIFIHWGLYSVPGWAPTTGELGTIPWEEWFVKNPYAEWYENTLRISQSPTFEYHRRTYGEKFPYEGFAELWRTERWDPKEWAQLFSRIKARYVVLTTKHHEGFCLWPSEYGDFGVKSKGPKRDIVGELTEAVRKEDLRMGLYYSGLLDWHFSEEPIRNIKDLWTLYPQTYSYADYTYNQWRELIRRYHPDILWNDIGWPKKGEDLLTYLFAFYYNCHPEGVVNDRWTVPPSRTPEWCDYRTAEYTLNRPQEIVPYKWEFCRGLGYSFGYNRNEGEEYLLSVEQLVEILADVVSKNGNLLLNIGPCADGTIPEPQVKRLLGLGEWLKINEEAIFGTRPWVRAKGVSSNGVPLRFTRRNDTLYVIYLGKIAEKEVKLKDLAFHPGAVVRLLGWDAPIPFATEGKHLTLRIPEASIRSLSSYPVFAVTPAPCDFKKEGSQS